MIDLEEWQKKQIQVNRTQFIENITHEDIWFRIAVPTSNLTHIMMQSDRDWLDENYPEVVLVYLDGYHLKHPPTLIDYAAEEW